MRIDKILEIIREDLPVLSRISRWKKFVDAIEALLLEYNQISGLLDCAKDKIVELEVELARGKDPPPARWRDAVG